MTFSSLAHTDPVGYINGYIVGGWCERWNVGVIRGAQTYDTPNPDEVWVLDPSTTPATLVKVATSGSHPVAPDGGQNQASMTWVPPVGKFYCFNNIDLYSCWTLTPPEDDPITGTWVWDTEEFTGTGTIVDLAGAGIPRYGAWRWAPKLKCIVYLANTNHDPSIIVCRPIGAV
jgi:hypothetical protein